MAELKALVDRLAGWKQNHLQLYVEHTIAYPGHEDAWRAASPLTLEEVSELDAYAAGRGIALTANQNCLGHVERWLRHPRYAPLGEVDRPRMDSPWGTYYLEPNTFCPTDPRALELVREWLTHLLPRCSGAYANIGCDEPLDLGVGRSKPECARIGPKAVFSAWVGKVAAMASALGKRPQFWCDPHPNEDDALPRELVALVWGYDHNTDFATRIAAHRALGRETWVCPGTGGWSSWTGRTANRRANLAAATAQGLAGGSAGLLMTEWGDRGHRQQWPITLIGLADGAQAAWSGGAQFDDSAAGLHAFGSAELGRWLAELGDIDRDLAGPLSYPLFADGFADLWHVTDAEKAPAWRELGERIAAHAARLPAIGGLVERECRHALACARWGAERAVLRREGITTAVREKVAAGMCELIAEHRALWFARSRPGGLEDSCWHYRRHAFWW